jgi:hypothetical protein
MHPRADRRRAEAYSGAGSANNRVRLRRVRNGRRSVFFGLSFAGNKETMNTFLKALWAVMLALAASAACAHGGVRFGFGFGVPLYGYGPWYYPPYYYPPPVVVAPAAPPVYIEPPQAQAAPPQQQGEWWYYCADSKTYYPYVESCASEWQRVPPRPPGT